MSDDLKIREEFVKFIDALESNLRDIAWNCDKIELVKKLHDDLAFESKIDLAKEPLYKEKFKSLHQMCDDIKNGKIKTVMIHHPSVLGDSYREIITSLDLISDTGASIFIRPKKERPTIS